MKRALLVLVVLFLLPAAPAEAKAKNALPRVRIGEIVPAPDQPGSYVIPLDAADPDGFVTELTLDFGDGVVLQMLLFCDPETGRPGESVHQEITWSYGPGKYKLRAQATSTPRCFDGEFQDSKVDRAMLRVR
jgi:hypothetical protein